MRLERAHTQFLGEGEGLLVVGFGLLSLQWRALRCNLTEKPEGIGFVALFSMCLREL
jgi:Na+/H+ antiporter NhaA